MSERIDPSIKLFGKMIQLSSGIEPSCTAAAVSATKDDKVDYNCESSGSDQKVLCSKQGKNRGNEEATTEEAMDSKHEGEPSLNSVLEVSKTPTSPSIDTDNPETPTKENMSSSQDLPKKDQEQSDEASSNSGSPDQNPLKKPDKVIPCARCNSMDTKFCYFNNYNVNQPRYFCKNCQRYWTAGGSMRNVPVGAGRRKSKTSAASQRGHLVIPGASDGLIHHVMRSDGTVLAFGLDSSLPNQSKQEASMLRIGDGNFLTNGFSRSENEKNSPVLLSNSSSITIEKGSDCNGDTLNSQAIPCFPYSWNPTTWQSGFPVSFYSASSPQWGDNLAGHNNLLWLPTPTMNSDQSSTNPSPNSTSLGKHSRECMTLMPSNSDRKDPAEEKELMQSRVVMPKKLKVNDPSEAAKNSIWTTLGIKNNHHHVDSSTGRVAFFGGLQQAKGVNFGRSNINPGVEASSLVLQANPAAFSRSLSFHEIAQ